MSSPISRRRFLHTASLGGAGLATLSWLPAWAQPVSAGIAAPLPTVSGTTSRCASRTR